ncbi:adenosine deaminase [Chromobacterium phragmitis]|uniref:Adenosine deaminase n=1 Tax=Chromobacterium phragmitis TaxID=2202141 RepID=A0A344UHZ1_9NEIS|nr:adenosine deaminase [Chromobacterium phragmitis]AXE29512.1 adenosine deaminase [Chromobacterium phragmitis]AXE34889.1 adenosine deaminase [Chromobacterium phragmitis]
MKLLLLPAALLALGLTGCASILNDQTQQVNVSSSTGTEIKGTIDGQAFKAPGIVNLKRENKNKIIMTETEGCAQQTVAEKTVDPKFFINILSGGAFGSTTDYSTEKMWKYSDNIVVSCRK